MVNIMNDTETDILQPDNVLEENRSRGFLYFASATVVLSLFLLVLLSLLPIDTPPVLEDSGEILTTFYDKTSKLGGNFSLSAEEVNVFLKEIQESNTYLAGFVSVPDKITCIFNEKTADIFVDAFIWKLKVTLSAEATFEIDNKARLHILPKKVSLGRLSIPGQVVLDILELFNLSVVYTVPKEVKALEVISGNLLVIGDKIAFSKAKRKVEKKKAKKQKTTKRQAAISDLVNKESAPVAKEETAYIPPVTPKKNLEPVKLKTVNKAKTVKPRTIKPNKVSDAKAGSLHKTADYFHKTRKNEFALKYYKQIVDEYPEYTKIDEVKTKIKILKSYKDK